MAMQPVRYNWKQHRILIQKAGINCARCEKDYSPEVVKGDEAEGNFKHSLY